MSVWKLGSDPSYETKVDLWLGGACMIPGIKCEVCGQTWMIPTTYCLEPVSPELRNYLSKAKSPMSCQDLKHIRMLMGNRGADIFPGARIGPTKVKKLSGKIDGEVAWFAGTAVLVKNDFEKLRALVGNDFQGCVIETKPNQPTLIELVEEPLNLRRFYPMLKCSSCDRRDCAEFDHEELKLIYQNAESSGRLFAVQGGMACGDKVRQAVESLGLRNCRFEEWTIESERTSQRGGAASR